MSVIRVGPPNTMGADSKYKNKMIMGKAISSVRGEEPTKEIGLELGRCDGVSGGREGGLTGRGDKGEELRRDVSRLQWLVFLFFL